MEQKKQEHRRNIQKIKDEIELLDYDLSVQAQTASNYKIYRDNRNRLTEQLARAQTEYDLLFTPEELLIRDSQLKVAQQQQRVEQEKKYREQQEELRIKQEEELRLCRLNEEKRQREIIECKERMKSQIDKDNRVYVESIQDKLDNKPFLNSELSKLEAWWDDLTQYGQPCNASYFLELYQTKKKILIDLIQKL
jgi:uncharacterized protein YacL (UPF0231 family)